MGGAPFDRAVAPCAALLELGLALKQAGYRHVTVSPATHRKVAARPEKRFASSLVDVLGWSRPFRERDLPPHLVALLREAGVLEPDGDGWRSTVRLSSLGEQLYFHSAYPTTDRDAVFFGPDTYRFLRALHAGLGAGPVVRRAVDIGCGAGPAAIAIALRWPKAEVLAVDTNHEALRMTALNAAMANAGVLPLHSDLLAAASGQFDLIVANPPYLQDPERRAYRHGGGELGAGLSLAIVEAALERLAPGGRLLLYTGVAMVDGKDPFLARTEPLLRAAGAGWRYEEIDPDLFGEELDQPAYRHVERIAAVWLEVERWN